MALQGATHFKDIRYNGNVSYGELFLQNEHEMSVFNLEEADTSVLRQHFALYEQVRPPPPSHTLPQLCVQHSLCKCSIPVLLCHSYACGCSLAYS